MFDGAYPPGVTGAMIDKLENRCCCENCRFYNGNYCTKEWNNADEEYCVPARDEKDSDDYCEDWDGDVE